MLQLKNIKKDYLSGDTTVQALKGIDIEFRESEFVSVLGQSGCGKTTLLNIIGGLDRYTSGDLVINGRSTKEYKDRDWDTYRNHSVGFVFQTYNLIPHQTVLSNVELALTLSGVSKEERRKRAIESLEAVGLKDQINKKPNQMSGGQMQRVAIARALVNNPDIILADEPTGALDTKTSVQIMEILKEISKDKLIIMVTHNPNLAEKYSSRVVKVLDGEVIEDSNPYKAGEVKKEEVKKAKGKNSMSFFTALSLSLNNLMTKKGRTFLTSFAGSIGIIGIALILSISNGVQNYINRIQEDTLSSYPIEIQEESIDLTSMMLGMMGTNSGSEGQEEGKVYSNDIMVDMISSVTKQIQKNNLEQFKKFIEENDNIKQYTNAIKYGYNLNLNLYNSDTSNGAVQVNPSPVMDKIGLGAMMGGTSSDDSGMSFSMGSSFSSMDVWTEMLDNQDLINSQYDVLSGKFAENYNEVVLIVDENNQVSDYMLYTLGLKDQEDLNKIYKALQKGEELAEAEKSGYSYEDLLGLKFKILLNTDYYEKENNMWVNKSDDEDYMKQKVDKAEEIKVVGIIKAKAGSSMTSTTGEIGYTKDLKEYVINKINDTQIVKEQKEKENINVFTGLEFDENSSSKFDMSSLSAEQQAYIASLSQAELAQLIENYSSNSNATYESNLSKLGVVDLDSPSSISIYPKDFESKELIQDEIGKYNTKQREDGKEENVINYSDIVGTMMSSVSVIVNVISYVLIAFVAISLIVSSIMIGIITYISVLERTKEIGILRSIGASKKDISRVFNAETLIVGLVAGALGIGITVLLCIPINFLIQAISGVAGVSASLPVVAGVALIAISMFLTMIAGLIPSKMASKKDPVEALRTE